MEIKKEENKNMRKIIMIVLSFLMILNIPMSHAHADNTVEQILDNYIYEIFENDEKDL